MNNSNVGIIDLGCAAPKHPEHLAAWFIVESVFIGVSFVVTLAAIIVLSYVKIHYNLKVFGYSVIGQYFHCGISRLIILGFQSGVFSIPQISCHKSSPCAAPEQSHFLVVASIFRSYYLGFILSMMFWLSLERQFAFYYIQDYEKNPRKWLSYCLVSVHSTFCFLVATIYSFEWFLWYVIVFFEFFMAILGFFLYFQSYKRSKMLLREFNISQNWTDKYSLSLRLQLKENLWAAKLLRNIFLTLITLNVYTCAAFFISTFNISREYFSEETIEIFDCIFNILIAVNVPVLALGTFAFNEYLNRTVKTVIFRKRRKIDSDATNIYFLQLKHQWDGPQDMKKSALQRRKTIL